MIKKICLIIFFLFLPVMVNSLEVYPERLIVFTNESYFLLKITVYNPDNYPVKFMISGKTYTLRPFEAKIIGVNLTFGKDLIIYHEKGKKVIKVNWKRSNTNLQEPPVNKLVVPAYPSSNININPFSEKYIPKDVERKNLIHNLRLLKSKETETVKNSSFPIFVVGATILFLLIYLVKKFIIL